MEMWQVNKLQGNKMELMRYVIFHFLYLNLFVLTVNPHTHCRKENAPTITLAKMTGQWSHHHESKELLWSYSYIALILLQANLYINPIILLYYTHQFQMFCSRTTQWLLIYLIFSALCVKTDKDQELILDIKVD